MPKLAIYMHWPFCLSKCPYCDFNSRPVQESLDHKEWADAYVRHLDLYAKRLPNRIISSLYFGGGTPSLMEPHTVEAVINTVAMHWKLSKECEITLEANPTSVLTEKLKAFRAAGVNRLSLGVQSFDDAALQFLGRAHNVKEAKEALNSVASIFDRFSFDLIYARAGQSIEAWQKELEQAMFFKPKHLSVYQLTIEPRTLFYKKAKTKTLVVDDELASEMYELTHSFLTEAGLPAYEVSNHAAVGQESRHNLTYWRYDDYIGVGPGAHGRFVDVGGRWGTLEHETPKEWLSLKEKGLTQEQISQDVAMQEAVMMGLRLVQGIDKKAWAQKFNTPLSQFIESSKIQFLFKEGLLKETDCFVSVTPRGMQRLNSVLNYLL